MEAVAIIVESVAAPGRRDDLFDLYAEHLAPRAEANPDQLAVAWCADQQNPDGFVLFEIYRSVEAMQANAGTEWFGAYMAAAMPLLAGEPTVTMLDPRWVTGLVSS